MKATPKNSKVHFYDGVRGAAALIVVFHHLELAFALDLDSKVFTFFFNNTNSYFLSAAIQSLFNVLLNGNLAIYVFFFMSAYVISIKLFLDGSRQQILGSSIKRYFRLMPSILASVLLGFLLMNFDLMYNHQLWDFLGNKNEFGSFYQFEPNLFAAIKSGVWNVLFTKNLEGYNGPLWTMNFEYFGSLICFGLFALLKTKSNRYYFYLILITLTFWFSTFWLTAFIFGFFMCDIDYTSNKLKPYFLYIEKSIFSKNIIVITSCLLLLILGREDASWLYTKWSFTNVLVSSTLVIIISKTEKLRQLFSFKIIVWIGRISFAIYVLHWPIICSFTSYIYLITDLSRPINVVISGGLSILLILVLASIFTQYIDKNAIRLANKIEKIVAGKI